MSGPADVEVAGDDAALAAVVAGRRHPRVAFVPDPGSDLARAVGLGGQGAAAGEGGGGGEGGEASERRWKAELPMDALRCGEVLAVNVVVSGTAPDHLHWWHRRWPCRVSVDGRVRFAGAASGVVVATGQFLRGKDLVPRGHPGDGRAEIQVYAVAPPARAAVRERLPVGSHVPHPDIVEASGAAVTVEWPVPRHLEVDGHRVSPSARLVVELVPGAYRLLV